MLLLCGQSFFFVVRKIIDEACGFQARSADVVHPYLLQSQCVTIRILTSAYTVTRRVELQKLF